MPVYFSQIGAQPHHERNLPMYIHMHNSHLHLRCIRTLDIAIPGRSSQEAEENQSEAPLILVPCGKSGCLAGGWERGNMAFQV